VPNTDIVHTDVTEDFILISFADGKVLLLKNSELYELAMTEDDFLRHLHLGEADVLPE
jgi:hypothetical protein